MGHVNDLYRTLFQESKEAVFIVSENGKFSDANDAFMTMVGYAKSTIKRKTVADLVPDKDEFETLIGLLEQDGFVKDYQMQIRSKHGILNTLSTITVQLDDNGRISNYMGIIQDVTSHTQFDENLRERKELLEALNQLSQDILSEHDPQAILETVVQRVVNFFDATSAYITEYDEAKKVEKVVADYYAPEASKKERVSDLGVEYTIEDFETHINRFKKHKYSVHQADDPNTSEFQAQQMEEFGGKTILEIPLVAHGQLVGSIDIWESRKRREYSESELEMAQAIGRQVALAVDNARLFSQAQSELAVRQQAEETAKEAQEKLKALQAVTAVLDKAETLADLYKQTISLGLEHLGFERMGLLLYEKHVDKMRGTFGIDEDGNFYDESGLLMDTGEAFMELFEAEERVVLWPDVPLYTKGEVTGRGWNAVSVLWDGSEGLGWLVADNGITGSPPPAYLLDIINLYGDAVGRLIAHKRAENITQEFQEKLRVLQDINLDLSHIDQMEDLYQQIISHGRERLGFDRMGLLLYEPETNSMIGTFGTDTDGKYRNETDFREEISDPDLLKIIKHKTPLGLWQDKGLRDKSEIVGQGWNAMATLLYEDTILGWLAVDNLINHEPLLPYQTDLLTLYATTIAHLLVRKKAQANLREREDLLQLVLDTIPQAVFWKDRNSIYLGANQKFAEDAGIANPEDIIGKSDYDLAWQKEEADFFVAADRKVMESDVAELGIIEPQLQAGGKQAWLETNKAPLHDINNNVIGILGTYEDITEKRQAQLILQEQEQLLRLVLDTIPQAVFWKDRNSIYLGANQKFAEDAGVGSPDQVIGKSDYDMAWKKEEADFFVAADREVMNNNKAELGIVEPQLQADGKQAWLETNKAPLHDSEGNVIGILGTYEDVTERYALQEQLQESLANRNKQLEIGTAITHSQGIEETLQTMVDKLDHYPQVAISVTLLENEGDSLVDVSAAQNAHDSGLSLTPIGTRRVHNQNPLAAFYNVDKPFISNNVGTDERLPESIQKAFTQANIISMAILPLAAGGTWLGNLSLMSQEENFFNDHTLSLYRSVAEQGATAVRAALLYSEAQSSLQRREREVSLSTQIAQEIASASDLSDLYQRVVTQIQEQFGYYHTQLLRYDPAMETVALTVGYGKVGEEMLALHHSIPIGVGLIGKAAATGRSILRSNLTDDSDWRPNPLLPEAKGELAVPIKLGDTVLGVLDVQSNTINELDENDQLILEGLCGQIAVAIDSTTLRQDMEARLRELNILQRQMSRDGWQDYRTVKSRVNGFQYDQAGVRALSLEATPQLTNGQTQNGKQNEITAVVDNSLATPLQVRGETIGILGLQDDPDRPLTDEEQEFLTAVSKEVAEALEAARLFEQTQDALAEQERLTSELETVAQVSTAASTILEVDALLQAVVDLSKTSFDLYHVHIYLLNESGKKLTLKAGAGNVGRLMALEGREISLDADSLVARAARTRQGVLENNVRKTVDFLPHPLLPNTQAEIAVPMILGDKLIGVLDLQSDRTDSFSTEDLKIQRTLASQISIAVENARQYAEQVETSTKLREVDQLKSEFLASMSHELRTPLNSIIGFADVLLEGLDGELNERMEEDVRLIRESGRHLRELIGDILDMSKIEAGRMDLRYEEIDLRQMAQDIMATAQPLAQAKDLDMYLDLDDDVTSIQADRTRLRQVLWNIMGNAIKFTEKGSVSLSMHNKGNHVLIAIRDTGVGIKEENIAVVFEQFRQIDGGLNRAAGGTGLGMPITKKLVEIHGGDIWIESAYGQGSTFFFTIPFNPPAIPETGPLTMSGS